SRSLQSSLRNSIALVRKAMAGKQWACQAGRGGCNPTPFLHGFCGNACVRTFTSDVSDRFNIPQSAMSFNITRGHKGKEVT
ncbi:hypothetical protein ACX3U9_03015, partial [Corynebacterium pyruviciproducens]